MSKKVFFVDLDGTLLTDEKKVSPETKKAIIEYLERGNYFAICTGRPIISAVKYYESLGISDHNSFIISFNGAQIYDCENKKTISRTPMSYELTDKVFKIAEKIGVFIQTFSDTHIITKELNECSDFYSRTNPIPYIVTDDVISALSDPPSKSLACELHDHKKLEALGDEVQKELGDDVQISFSSDYYLEFFSKDAGKGNAVRQLCQFLNVPIEDSIAAGDHQNDLTMLRAAGLSIAMCNGTEEAKENAMVITESDNNHNGLVPYFDACR